MNREEFKQMFKHDFLKMLDTMANKQGEYAADENAFHNFDQCAAADHTTPERALWGMLMKHYSSVLDMKNQCHQRTFEQSFIDEKIDDMIVYLMLLKGLLYRRYNYPSVAHLLDHFVDVEPENGVTQHDDVEWDLPAKETNKVIDGQITLQVLGGFIQIPDGYGVYIPYESSSWIESEPKP